MYSPTNRTKNSPVSPTKLLPQIDSVGKLLAQQETLLSSSASLVKAYNCGNRSNFWHDPRKIEPVRGSIEWLGLRPLIIRSFYELHRQTFSGTSHQYSPLEKVDIEHPYVIVGNDSQPLLTCLVSALNSRGDHVVLAPYSRPAEDEFLPGTILQSHAMAKTRISLLLGTEKLYPTLLLSPHALREATRALHRNSKPEWSICEGKSVEDTQLSTLSPFVAKVIRKSIAECEQALAPKDPDGKVDHDALKSFDSRFEYPSTDDLVIRQISKPDPWVSVTRAVVANRKYFVQLVLHPSTYELSAQARAVT